MDAYDLAMESRDYDVSVATDLGGGAHVRHDPNYPVTHALPGSVARVDQITHAIECGDAAWLGQFFANLEADVAKIEGFIQVATDRLNGEQEEGLNQRSIEDMRRDLKDVQRVLR